MKSIKKLRIYASALLITGLVGVLPSFYYSFQDKLGNNNSVVSAFPASQKQKSQNSISGIPTTLIINNLRLSLPIEPGNYSPSSQEWTLSDTTALYATMSAPVNNEGGGTLIYGHDIPQVFRPLHGLEEGDRAIIITNNGYKFVYEFTSSRTFDPSDSSVLSYQGQPQMYLQTCSGIWSQHRQIFSFNLVSYEKIKTQSVSNILKDLTTELITPSAGIPALDVVLESS